LEISDRGSRDEITVGVQTRWQRDDAGHRPGAVQAASEQLGSLRAGLVRILIENDVDQAARAVILELSPLSGCQMSADGTGGITETHLPEHGQIEQALHQDDFRMSPHPLPGE